jgi:hypothetical protein
LIGDELLDQACLTYSERDTSERHQKAQRLLAKEPALSQANIFTAAAVGDLRTAEALLKQDPALATAKGGPRNWQPLLYLCYARIESGDSAHNPLEVAKLLLASGADPNAFFKYDYGSLFTALTGAFGEGERGPANQPPHYQCTQLARLLLDEGADPNDGQALYNRMFRHGPGNECIELLLSYGLKASDKVNWQENSSTGTLDFLLEYAVKKGFASRVILLLKNGANPNFSGFYEPKKTPYEHALECGHEQIAAVLKKAGGRTPEHG